MVDNTHARTATSSLVKTASEFLDISYDFLIVGGGTAGLVVAARLTEDPKVNVGVLEAGNSHLGDPLVDIPGAFSQQLSNPEYDYAFYTEPQTANGNIRHQHPRGKGLGGSSAINYLMYVRGSNEDYNNWASLVGDEGWSANSLRPYMKKHQTLEPVDPSVNRTDTTPFVGENHGHEGPIKTSFNSSILPIEHATIDAADELTGLSKKPLDPWGGDHIGFYNTLGTVSRSGNTKGTRSYAASGYFAPNAGRPNLKVLCDATVNEIILEGDKANGVKFLHHGESHHVQARREVILSCGTYLSPQLLELSGIGDPKILLAAGVETKIPLPGVGNNLQDHILTAAVYDVASGVDTLDGLFKPEFIEAAQKEFEETQSGVLTEISSCQGFFPYKLLATPEQLAETLELAGNGAENEFQKKQKQFVKSELGGDASANLQFLNIPVKVDLAGAVQDQSKVIAPPEDPNAPGGICLQIACQYPTSRGYVHIKSSDPAERPSINPRYLSNEADVNLLASGLQFLERMAKSTHLVDKITGRFSPRSELDLTKIEDAKRAVHEFIHTQYHPVGTCAMGDVVDSRLRVKGVKSLRVIDASVFPLHVSGNIVGSVYTVAEKGADLVKEDWNMQLSK
ncbi:GMC oxidoreductase [Myriangium duriaei CBS 260.36]|uniref:GMC oxidoreductase n=1 Tax=Myriangium duriaei CBS 260.36 TaxID=1168546 RepID=A0A9P4MLT5_9PEZI|nr:GMC oxidoreductase [Myriangium duriaei CBS 260.36]